MQVRHEVEARVELDVIVRFQNYFVGLHAWRAIAQWQTELGLQLLDLRQERTDVTALTFRNAVERGDRPVGSRRGQRLRGGGGAAKASSSSVESFSPIQRWPIDLATNSRSGTRMAIGSARFWIAAGGTTAVVLIVAPLTPEHAWQQPILSLLDARRATRAQASGPRTPAGSDSADARGVHLD